MRTDYTTQKMPEPGVAIHMTTANSMVVGVSSEQLKKTIHAVGGFANFQVKYQGKPCKSYLIPQSQIPSRVLQPQQHPTSVVLFVKFHTLRLSLHLHPHLLPLSLSPHLNPHLLPGHHHRVLCPSWMTAISFAKIFFRSWPCQTTSEHDYKVLCWKRMRQVCLTLYPLMATIVAIWPNWVFLQNWQINSTPAHSLP